MFKPDVAIPAEVVDKLQEEVAGQRDNIEDAWVVYMIDMGWVRVRVTGKIVTLCAYPNTPNQFERMLDLRRIFPKDAARAIAPEDIVLSRGTACLEIFPQRPRSERHHLRLSRLLWTDPAPCADEDQE